MAIMDYRAQLCDATTFSGATNATVISTYIVDFGHSKKFVGRGEPVYLHVRTKTAFSPATNTTTLALFLQHANTNNVASYSNLVNLNLNGAANVAALATNLTAGKLLYSGALPTNVKRYIRIKGTIATSALSAGQIDAWLDIAPLPTDYE